jgi:beta-mannosidase
MRYSFALTALAIGICSVYGAASGDNNGIIGTSVQSLNGKWELSNGSATSLTGNVPGDLITDLELGGVIGDPLYELNFKKAVWDMGNWSYTLSFSPTDATSAHYWVVFEGIKMVADVSLNGQWLGYASDQFLRYAWDVTSILKPSGSNTLTVTFPSFNDARNSEERWMSCSGGCVPVGVCVLLLQPHPPPQKQRGSSIR